MISPFMETLSTNVYPSRTYPRTMHQKEFDFGLGKVSLHGTTWVVLNHEIFKKGIKVDKAKIDVIAKLPILKFVKDIRSFLGHTGLYRRFIKNFRKIVRLLTNLLVKGVSFILNDGCLTAWEKLKMELISCNIP